MHGHDLVIKTPFDLIRKHTYPKYIFIDFTVVCPWSISWGQSYIGPPDAANGAARNKIKDYAKHFNFLCDQRDQHDLLPEVNSFSLGIVAFECLGSYAKISEGILNMIADALARKQPKYKALEWKGFICTSVNKLLLRNIAEVYQQFISSWTRHTALLAHNQPPSESTGTVHTSSTTPIQDQGMEVPAELAVQLDGYVESSGDNVQTPSVWNQITIQSVIVKREPDHINQLLSCFVLFRWILYRFKLRTTGTRWDAL